MSQFSIVLSVPKDSKADRINEVIEKAIPIVFWLLKFKKVTIVRAEEIECLDGATTDEHVYTFEY